MSWMVVGSVRYIIYLTIFWVGYAASGGHLGPIFQPYILFMHLGFYLASIFFFCGTLNPKSPEQRSAFYEAGRAGFALSAIVPFIGGIVQTFGLLNQGNEVIGYAVGASMVSLLLAPFPFFAFFKWADPKVGCVPKELPVIVNLEKLRNYRKTLSVFFWTFFVFGLLSFSVLLVIIVQEMTKEPYISPYDRSISYDAREAAQVTTQLKLKQICPAWDGEAFERYSLFTAREQQRLMNINEVF